MRRPWLLLEAIAAPIDDQESMLFARSQVLRLSSATFRRYEIKYSSWPFRLRAFYDQPGSSAAAAVAQELLDTDPRVLDPYSAGLRNMFRTLDELLPPACKEVIRADFGAHAYTTDLVERLHADVTHNISKRSPGQNFANFSRAELLRQAAVIHTAKGGVHPLDTKSKGLAPQLER